VVRRPRENPSKRQYDLTLVTVRFKLRHGAGNGTFRSTRVQVLHEQSFLSGGSMAEMKSDPDKVWPTGLTEAESEEIHRNVIQGTQIFGFIAVLAHLFAYIYSPWLK
jgi:light-harvesting protein B-800-850 beta chain